MASVLSGHGHGHGHGNDVGGFEFGRGGGDIYRRPASTPALTGSLYSALMESSSITNDNDGGGGPSGFTFSTTSANDGGDGKGGNDGNEGVDGGGGKEGQQVDVGGGVGISMNVFGSPQFCDL